MNFQKQNMAESGAVSTELKEDVRTSKGTKWQRELLSIGRDFFLALLTALLLTRFVFTIPAVPTPSMVPTIGVDERVFVDKLSLLFAPVERGQIVVFPCPDIPEELYIKRVIGLPGETITIHDGKVYVDDRELEEPYLTVHMLGRFGPYKVPEGHIFVMGDNRNNSIDSRAWKSTSFIDLKDVEGRGVAIMWPLNQMRLLY